MDTEALIERAQLLLHQNRYDMAEQVAGQALLQEPDNWYALGLISLCVAQDRNRLVQATQSAEQAVHLAPGHAWPHYVLSSAWDKRNQDDRAMRAIQDAIALDPDVAEYHAMAAYLWTKMQNWMQALESSYIGLSLDPLNQGCSAARSLALERIGMSDVALEEANRAISNAPDSPDAHASRGWALLSLNRFQEAQPAFREALRLDPDCDFARTGMIQALNGNNILYRWLHRWMTKIDRQDGQSTWIKLLLPIAIGGYLLKLTARHPVLFPAFLTISIAYGAFIVMTWMIHPFFNMMLRFHRFGRHLLSEHETRASNCIAFLVAMGICSAISTITLSGDILDAAAMALYVILLAIPTVIAFTAPINWVRKFSLACAVLFSIYYFYIFYASVTHSLQWWHTISYVLGLALFSYFARYMQDKEVRV